MEIRTHSYISSETVYAEVRPETIELQTPNQTHLKTSKLCVSVFTFLSYFADQVTVALDLSF